MCVEVVGGQVGGYTEIASPNINTVLPNYSNLCQGILFATYTPIQAKNKWLYKGIVFDYSVANNELIMCNCFELINHQLNFLAIISEETVHMLQYNIVTNALLASVGTKLPA